MEETTIMYRFEKPEINPDDIPGRKDFINFFKENDLTKYLKAFPETVNFGYFKTMGEDDFITECGITDENDIEILLNAVHQAQEEEEEEAEEQSQVNNRSLNIMYVLYCIARLDIIFLFCMILFIKVFCILPWNSLLTVYICFKETLFFNFSYKLAIC